MREIRFRAWHKESKKMYEVFRIDFRVRDNPLIEVVTK